MLPPLPVTGLRKRFSNMAAEEAEKLEKNQDAQGEEQTGEAAEEGLRKVIYTPAGNKKAAILNGEIEILHGSRLEQYDNGPAQAYAARPADMGSQGSYFALICPKGLIPRARLGPSYANIINTSLVKLIGSGKVFWPPDNAERYCFVYENNLGQPLLKTTDQVGRGMKSDLIMHAVIRPIVGVLHDLRDKDIAHGCIRPSNIFDGGKKQVERVILGDCLSLPPSYSQPALYEPIERALCDPNAKGHLTIEDDIYAFGITVSLLMRTHNPLKGYSDEDIIRTKMEKGSYAAVTGSDRFTGPILEFLRGVLCDDRRQRWTIDDITSWLDGQRLSPKQGSKKPKAARPIQFNGKRYFQPSQLALDLNKNQAEAMQIIENGTLAQWIERSLEDGMATGRLESAVESTLEYGRGSGYWERMISRVMVALDPDFPICIKDMRIHPDGISNMLANAFYENKDLMPFMDLINQKAVIYWLNSQYDDRADYGVLVSRFDGCRAFLRQKNVGYGIERCLYFLNPECPCLSEKLEGYYIRSPEDLMYAYEDMAKNPNRPDMFLDRHVVAFLSVKERQVVDPYLIELNSSEYYQRVLANLKCLASIQKRAKMEAFPGIARWISDILGPVYERYHDRQLREKLQERIEKVVDSGDLMKLAAILDSPDVIQKDLVAFKKAMNTYSELQEDLEMLEKRLEKPETFGQKTGQEVAAIFAAIISGIMICGFALYFFMNGGSPFL